MRSEAAQDLQASGVVIGVGEQLEVLPQLAIRERALDHIDEDELGADAIGRDGVMTNKHLRTIKQIYDLTRYKIELLPEIRFAKFMVPDLKNERDA